MANINTKDFRVSPGQEVDLKKWPTLTEPVCKSKSDYTKLLEKHTSQLSDLQRLHYASNRCALLLIFQGLVGELLRSKSRALELHRMATTDGLTGLVNREAFGSRVAESTIFSGAARNGFPHEVTSESSTARITRKC